MDIFGTKKNFETEALEARVVAQEERIRVLEAAMHTLVDLERQNGCPHSSHGNTGGRGGNPIAALEPFVTHRDIITGRTTRPGVGSQ